VGLGKLSAKDEVEILILFGADSFVGAALFKMFWGGSFFGADSLVGAPCWQ
jgi:hypothetical protein